ncbi:MAG: hypothetical protein JST90_13930 [Bacteroidetes bacterium]|nr:hypothetical protein [Bacteroidota bacterium]
MIISLQPAAEEAMFEIAEFINAVHTDGAGARWIDKLTAFLKSYAKSDVQYVLCRNEDFLNAKLSCITFNGWVIAFKIMEDEFVVFHIVRGDLLQ